ncbi:hypothetical protein IJQ19_04030 [bacterium]|nr:hypothetical protein [bacterium]
MSRKNSQDIERIKLTPTSQISIEDLKVEDIAKIEQELRQMTIDELLYRLNYEENDTKIMKLIKKIIKEKK